MPKTGSSIVILKQVDSTNNYAMAKVHAGMAKHGDSYFTTEQTAGKGQRGKQWDTANGVNIALSLVIEVKLLNASQQFQLLVSVALGCYDFFARYAGQETSIKWPNDIYWRDRKAVGVLIENVFQGGNWNFAVAGIGVNINQTNFDTSLKNPVSLKQITGKTFDLELLAEELKNAVLNRYDSIKKENMDSTLAEYNSHLFGLNKRVHLKKGPIHLETTIQGVSSFGQLITLDAQQERRFDFGEVEWVI
jgi:BirA family biotin operon repressor/biotin-[acetyl-CoA-carboxylase] ligase